MPLYLNSRQRMMVKGEKRTTLILCPCVSSKANELQKTVLINMEVEGLRNNFLKLFVSLSFREACMSCQNTTHPPRADC